MKKQSYAFEMTDNCSQEHCYGTSTPSYSIFDTVVVDAAKTGAGTSVEQFQVRFLFKLYQKALKLVFVIGRGLLLRFRCKEIQQNKEV